MEPSKRGIDCHAHVFTRGLPRITDARYAPARDALVSEYLALLDAHGLEGGVLVQPSFLGTENSFMLDALATAPARLRAVAVVDRDAPPDELDDLDARGVVGIRLNLIGRDPPALDRVATPQLFREVVRRNWHVEIQAEGAHWPILLPGLLQSGARLVIDHFGRPSSKGIRCAGFQALLAAARDHEIWMKLSAPYRFDGEHAAACAATLLDAVGPARLVWGSDWPWTQHPEIGDYGATRRWLDVWIPDAVARDRILVENPRALFGFA